MQPFRSETVLALSHFRHKAHLSSKFLLEELTFRLTTVRTTMNRVTTHCLSTLSNSEPTFTNTEVTQLPHFAHLTPGIFARLIPVLFWGFHVTPPEVSCCFFSRWVAFRPVTSRRVEWHFCLQKWWDRAWLDVLWVMWHGVTYVIKSLSPIKKKWQIKFKQSSPHTFSGYPIN